MASISLSSSSVLPILTCLPVILCLTILPVSVSSEIALPVRTKGPTAEGVMHSFPSPWTNPEQCGRTSGEESWLCNADGVLSKEDADGLNNLLTTVNTNTSCVCNCSKDATTESGYVLAVAVVKILKMDNSNESNALALEKFSDTLKQQWFMDRTCEDGGLIVAHFNSSEIFISLGEALSDLLTKQSLTLIYEAIQPSLSARELTQALNTTIHQLSSSINEAIIAENQPPPDNLVWGIFGVITVSSILLFHYWIKY